MSAATQDDLKTIVEKLDKIEEKIGSKWALPLAVAVITGIIGIATVVIQISLEEKNAQYRAQLDQQRDQANAQKKQREDFYNELIALATDVYDRFSVECQRSDPTNDEKLNTLLREYRKAALKRRLRYDKEFIKRVLDYGEFVSESLAKIQSQNLGPDEKLRFLTDHEAKFRDTENAWSEFLNTVEQQSNQSPPFAFKVF